MRTYIGAGILLLFGLVVLIVGITTGGGLGVIVVGGLLTLSGILSILIQVINKRKENLEEENTND